MTDTNETPVQEGSAPQAPATPSRKDAPATPTTPTTQETAGADAQTSGTPRERLTTVPPDAAPEEVEVFHSGVLDQEAAEREGRTKVIIPNLGSKYLSGTWSGLANYQCPFCPYATTRGDTVIADHISKQHPEEEASLNG